MECDRCGHTTFAATGSYFNTEMICPTCEKKEKEHPLFETAREAEHRATVSGNLNYQGIGLPPELSEAAKARTDGR